LLIVISNLALFSCEKEAVIDVIKDGRFQFFIANSNLLNDLQLYNNSLYGNSQILFKIKNTEGKIIFEQSQFLDFQKYYNDNIFFSGVIDLGFASLSETERASLTDKLSDPSNTLSVDIVAKAGTNVSTKWSLYNNSSACFEYDMSNNSALYVKYCVIKILLE
jgi:hypothetical protein